MAATGIKRLNSSSFFEDPLCKKHAGMCSTLDDEDMGSSLTSSEITSSESFCDESESDLVGSSSSCLSRSTSEDSKCHVSFNTSVAVRVVYCDSDDSADEDDEGDAKAEEENEDSVVDLKKEDNSRPIMEAVHFDPEEEAIRSQLVGCICATRRKKPNFAEMYGCGKNIRNDDDSDSSCDDDDNFEFSEPPRVIVACAPSSSWFSL